MSGALDFVAAAQGKTIGHLLWWLVELASVGPLGLSQTERLFLAGYHTQGTAQTCHTSRTPQVLLNTAVVFQNPCYLSCRALSGLLAGLPCCLEALTTSNSRPYGHTLSSHHHATAGPQLPA